MQQYVHHNYVKSQNKGVVCNMGYLQNCCRDMEITGVALNLPAQKLPVLVIQQLLDSLRRLTNINLFLCCIHILINVIMYSIFVFSKS